MDEGGGSGVDARSVGSMEAHRNMTSRTPLQDAAPLQFPGRAGGRRGDTREKIFRLTSKVLPPSLLYVDVGSSATLRRRVVVEGERDREVVRVQRCLDRPLEVEGDRGGGEGDVRRGIGDWTGGHVRVVEDDDIVGVDLRRQSVATRVRATKGPLLVVGVDVADDDDVVVGEKRSEGSAEASWKIRRGGGRDVDVGDFVNRPGDVGFDKEEFGGAVIDWRRKTLVFDGMMNESEKAAAPPLHDQGVQPQSQGKTDV